MGGHRKNKPKSRKKNEVLFEHTNSLSDEQPIIKEKDHHIDINPGMKYDYYLVCMLCILRRDNYW